MQSVLWSQVEHISPNMLTSDPASRFALLSKHRCGIHQTKNDWCRPVIFAFGGPERTRTAYLLIANEAFYRVNYGPGMRQ